MSGSTQKAAHGKANVGGNVGPANSGMGAASVINFSENGAKKVTGEPALVREVNGKTIDFWNGIINAKSADLEKILNVARLENDYSMEAFVRAIEYQGFDRTFYIKHALTKMSVSCFCRFAIIGALRGSNFQKISETCERMPEDLTSTYQSAGFVKTPKRRTDLTILRSTACIPHWCALWMIVTNCVPKIPSSSCPPCIQFPNAASLPMSNRVRRQHLQFSYDFSMLLPNGRFNANIYMTAMKNTIPVEDIPQEVLGVLEIQSNSENYLLTSEDLEPFTKQVIKR